MPPISDYSPTSLRIPESYLAEINAIRASRGLESIPAADIRKYTTGDIRVVPDDQMPNTRREEGGSR
jgi:hypothetical protein